MKILVTGAAGSVGRRLVPRLESLGHQVAATDVQSMDVRDRDVVQTVLLLEKPDVVIHLAASKSAPDGEIDPFDVAENNVVGTLNVLNAARVTGARVLLASTCKAADPETAYGASKLLCERMTLAQGGTVARFFNVVEADGNVFRLWEKIPEADPIPVTPCWRYFITMDQACGLIEACLDAKPGRYTVDPGEPWLMRDVAEEYYPGRPLSLITPRRGDRDIEPPHAASEKAMLSIPGLLRIESIHDAA